MGAALTKSSNASCSLDVCSFAQNAGISVQLQLVLHDAASAGAAHSLALACL
jgi:hypothetical protein